MKPIRYFMPVAAAIALAGPLFIFAPIQRHEEIATGEKFRAFKMAKRKGDTSKKPTEWFTLSRAYPYDEIPFEPYKRALDRSIEILNQNSVARIGVWVMAGPSNVGGRVTGVAV